MDQEILTARLFFRAAFPVMKVPLTDDPAMRKAWQNVTATVQFSADVAGADKADPVDGRQAAPDIARQTPNQPKVGPATEPATIGACLQFDNGTLTVTEGLCDAPDLTLHFKTVAAMNALLRGGIALPRVRGALKHPALLVKTLKLLLALTLMLPRSKPKDPHKQYLKVKMSIYMITTALSVFNKLGDPHMVEWTRSQPDRIYQFTVEPYDPQDGVAAYLRVKGGRTKAGRGAYKRRRPFVHFRFSGIEQAMKVLLKETGFVESVEAGYVAIDGSPEYSSQLNDYMAVIQGMMT